MENEQTVEQNAVAPAAVTNEQLLEQLESLKNQLAMLSAAKASNGSGKMLPDPNRKYVLLETELKTWGRVPLQQAEIAKLLGETMELGREYSEAEVLSLVKENATFYGSLAKSVQTPERLFRYYRNLKNDGKHCGYVGRGFLEVRG